MNRQSFWTKTLTVAAALGLMAGCRNVMPHAFTWPASGDQIPSHPKPPEGGFYKDWDPFAASIELTPVEATNQVQTQHMFIATVRDKEGKPLPNRRVEWIIASGSVGDIVEVDESGIRASRGYKVDNHFAVSHTNADKHTLRKGSGAEIKLEPGQTWCVVTSPVEGDTHVIAYAPGIYDWNKHKAFAVKHWYDVQWQFPEPSTNPIGTTHDFVTHVTRPSDGTPLAGYMVTYRIVDGPDGTFDPGGSKVVTVTTDANGDAKATIKQAKPMEGTNNIAIDIVRKECGECKTQTHIAAGKTSKTWIGPKIGIKKSCPGTAIAGDTITYRIDVTNPSQVDTSNTVVTDVIPDGISYVSSTPAGQASGQTVTWQIGKVAAGGTASITVQAKTSKPGKFENCASVSADLGLSAKDCCTTVVSVPKLTIEKKCPGEVTICDPIEYVITVRNAGDAPAKNVKINDDLPAGLTTSDGKKSATANVGDLAPGASKEFRFTVKADKPGKYDNKVVATADGGMSVDASCSTTVRQPVLDLVKKGPEMRFTGRPAAYEITVTNKGDMVAKDTVVTDTVPAGTEFVSAGEGGTFGNGVVTWRLGNLDAGASKKVTVTVKPTVPGNVKNVATAKAACAEATAEANMPVKGVPAILLESYDDPDPIEVGSTTTYTIIVTNQGSMEDTNILVSAIIPDEEAYVSSDGVTKAAVDGKSVKFAALPKLAPKAKATWKIVVKGTKTADVRFKVLLSSDATGTVPVEKTESTHIYD